MKGAELNYHEKQPSLYCAVLGPLPVFLCFSKMWWLRFDEPSSTRGPCRGCSLLHVIFKHSLGKGGVLRSRETGRRSVDCEWYKYELREPCHCISLPLEPILLEST